MSITGFKGPVGSFRSEYTKKEVGCVLKQFGRVTIIGYKSGGMWGHFNITMVDFDPANQRTFQIWNEVKREISQFVQREHLELNERLMHHNTEFKKQIDGNVITASRPRAVKAILKLILDVSASRLLDRIRQRVNPEDFFSHMNYAPEEHYRDKEPRNRIAPNLSFQSAQPPFIKRAAVEVGDADLGGTRTRRTRRTRRGTQKRNNKRTSVSRRKSNKSRVLRRSK